jgi:hypothetical protein
MKLLICDGRVDEIQAIRNNILSVGLISVITITQNICQHYFNGILWILVSQ